VSVDQTTRADRKKRYHAVLRTVGEQTGGIQHPGVRPHVVTMIQAAHGRFTADGVERSLQAAIENDDLYRWQDDSGLTRYTLAIKTDLRRVAEYWAEREDSQRLEATNRAIEQVREDTPFHNGGSR